MSNWQPFCCAEVGPTLMAHSTHKINTTLLIFSPPCTRVCEHATSLLYKELGYQRISCKCRVHADSGWLHRFTTYSCIPKLSDASILSA